MQRPSTVRFPSALAVPCGLRALARFHFSFVDEAMMNDSLSVREERFVAEYLIDQNGAAAAARAGYAPKSSRYAARDLMKKPLVRERVRMETQALLSGVKASAVEVMRERARGAFFKPSRMLGPGWKLKAWEEMDEETKECLQIAVVQRGLREEVRIKQPNREKALLALEKVHERLERLNERQWDEELREEKAQREAEREAAREREMREAARERELREQREAREEEARVEREAAEARAAQARRPPPVFDMARAFPRLVPAEGWEAYFEKGRQRQAGVVPEAAGGLAPARGAAQGDAVRGEEVEEGGAGERQGVERRVEGAVAGEGAPAARVAQSGAAGALAVRQGREGEGAAGAGADGEGAADARGKAGVAGDDAVGDGMGDAAGSAVGGGAVAGSAMAGDAVVGAKDCTAAGVVSRVVGGARGGAASGVVSGAVNGAVGSVASGAAGGVVSGAAGGVVSGAAGGVVSGVAGGAASGAASGAAGDVASGAAGGVARGAVGSVARGAVGSVARGAVGGLEGGVAGGAMSGAVSAGMDAGAGAAGGERVPTDVFAHVREAMARGVKPADIGKYRPGAAAQAGADAGAQAARGAAAHEVAEKTAQCGGLWGAAPGGARPQAQAGGQATPQATPQENPGAGARAYEDMPDSLIEHLARVNAGHLDYYAQREIERKHGRVGTRPGDRRPPGVDLGYNPPHLRRDRRDYAIGAGECSLDGYGGEDDG
jgi:phage terminase small subunit